MVIVPGTAGLVSTRRSPAGRTSRDDGRVARRPRYDLVGGGRVTLHVGERDRVLPAETLTH